MASVLYTHSVFLEHDTGEHHPECADRLRAILKVLEHEDFHFLHRADSPMATIEQIERAHPPFHVESILENVPTEGHRHIDPDTLMSPKSGEAALRSAGGVIAAIDDVMAGRNRNAFCAGRPPGHHAERATAMGFCFFNNAAVGAFHLQKHHGVERVAVIDFDVHHGNGTADIFDGHADLFYASSHQSPCYPGTGKESETGECGNLCNLELAPGSGSVEMREGYEEKVLPALRQFNPDFLLISAGFDAHARDPLAHLRWQVDDYVWLTKELMSVAKECCDGRIVSMLEGGYDLHALAASTAAHIRELMHN